MSIAIRNTTLSLILIALFLIVAPQLFFKGPSGDLLAVWLAADSLATSRPEAVYAEPNPVFLMRPPDGWTESAYALGHEGFVYPYLYPPLVAALVAPLTQIIGFDSFIGVMGVVNAALLVAGILLAAKTAQGRPILPVFLGISLVALSLSKIGLLAMHENQPQFLVVFLIMLAIERSTSHRPSVAGVALAAAAAIKVYPALLVLIFVLRGQWRAFSAFLLAGAGLAAVSILLGGWQLHEDFLTQIRAVNGTILVSIYSYNINALAAFTAFGDQLEPITAAVFDADQPNAAFWHVMAKPPAWQAINTAALLALVTGAGLALRRRPEAAAAIWGGLLCAMALLMPISWPYYYLPVLMFMPVFVPALGPVTGGLCITVTVIATSIAFPERLAAHFDLPLYGFYPAFAGLFAALTGFLVSALRTPTSFHTE